MHRYIKGAVFERKIIHDLIDMGSVLAIRGAGSKSFGSIKADIMALFPSGYLVIIQAKNSSSKFKKEHEEFLAHKGIQGGSPICGKPQGCRAQGRVRFQHKGVG